MPNDEGFTYLVQSAEKDNNSCRILFNNDYYYICKNAPDSDQIIFSHVGYESNNFTVKTITVTISNRMWVLTTQPMNKMAIVRFTDSTYSPNEYCTMPMPTCGDPQQDIAIFLNYTQKQNKYMPITGVYHNSDSQDDEILTGLYCDSYGNGQILTMYWDSNSNKIIQGVRSVSFKVNYKVFDWNNINDDDDNWI